jgi:hypothetical protein
MTTDETVPPAVGPDGNDFGAIEEALARAIDEDAEDDLAEDADASLTRDVSL